MIDGLRVNALLGYCVPEGGILRLDYLGLHYQNLYTKLVILFIGT
jgi:hypothetical protein